MKHILDPLVAIPGVRRAMLFSPDGVPIVSTIRPGRKKDEDQDLNWVDSAEDPNAFTALAAGWLAEIRRAIDPLSWSAPHRVVLEASRGTLVLLLTPRANLSVELDRGATPEEVKLPMEAAVARMGRLLQRDKAADPAAAAGSHGEDSTRNEEPRGIVPGGEGTPTEGLGMNETTRNEVPEATRDS